MINKGHNPMTDDLWPLGLWTTSALLILAVSVCIYAISRYL